MKRLGWGLCVLGLVALSARGSGSVKISNLRTKPQENTGLVDIYYDLDSTISSSPSFPVMLLFGKNTKTMKVAKNVTGKTTGVANGTGHHLVWNARADWPGWTDTTRTSFKVQVGKRVTCPKGGDKKAVAWEIVNNHWVRNYYADGAMTMNDKNTNLTWVFDADANGTANWYTAKERCSDLVYAGHNDWFLPSKDQLYAIYGQKSVFKDVQSSWYWSNPPKYGSDACVVNMNFDAMNYSGKDSYSWIWPCRSRTN